MMYQYVILLSVLMVWEAETRSIHRQRRNPQWSTRFFGTPDFAFPEEISITNQDTSSNWRPNSPGRGANLIDGSNPGGWQNNNVWQNQNQNQNQNQVVPAGTPTPCEVRCHQLVTSEYNPICGSDNITYTNPSKFRCALKCGKNVTAARMVSCGFGFPRI